MLAFYREGGQLDESCRRLDATSLEALPKLYAHLRELERKSHRLEDLSDRLQEMATLDEQTVPHDFLVSLISSAHGHFDMEPWQMNEKVDPSIPRMDGKRDKPLQVSYLSKRKNQGKPTLTIEQAQLLRLKDWLEAAVLKGQKRAFMSQGDFDQYQDLVNLLHTAKAGLLNQGRKLKRIDLQLDLQADRVDYEVDDYKLSFPEMEIQRR